MGYAQQTAMPAASHPMLEIIRQGAFLPASAQRPLSGTPARAPGASAGSFVCAPAEPSCSPPGTGCLAPALQGWAGRMLVPLPWLHTDATCPNTCVSQHKSSAAITLLPAHTHLSRSRCQRCAPFLQCAPPGPVDPAAPGSGVRAAPSKTGSATGPRPARPQTRRAAAAAARVARAAAAPLPRTTRSCSWSA